MPEIHERQRESEGRTVIYRVADDSSSWATVAVILLVLLLFMFGLMFYLNYDKLTTWTMQSMQSNSRQQAAQPPARAPEASAPAPVTSPGEPAGPQGILNGPPQGGSTSPSGATQQILPGGGNGALSGSPGAQGAHQ